MIEVSHLGMRDYQEVWDLQKELCRRRAEGAIGDTLLLVEHPPVFTTGTSSAGVLGRLPYPVFAVERGGDVTYHGPGQLVGYPILHLGELGLKARGYLRFLEEVLIEAAGSLGVEAEALPGFTGVWSEKKKIASIGVGVRRQVSLHGFALNVNMDLSPFRMIHPCKLQPEEISSLSLILGRPVPLAEAARRVAGSFSRRWASLGSIPVLR